MGLIHQSHNHIPLTLILHRQLSPQPRKITCRRPTWSPNDGIIPPRIIMNIDNTMRARSQARLDQGIVLCKIGLVKSTAEDVVDEVLPADREAKDVESIALGKMRHLAGAVATTILGEGRIDGGEDAGTLRIAVSYGRSWDFE